MCPATKLIAVAIFAAAAIDRPCFADSLLAMGGPLAADPNPHALDLGAFGNLDISGAVSGLAFVQDNPTVLDKGATVDLNNALLLVQSGGWLQFFAAVGAYSFPSLGTAYLEGPKTPDKTYGDAPEVFAKAAFFDGFSIEAGKLPSLIGGESVFTIQNMNVERGLLWNQTPTISRGVQLNYASGAVSLSLSWNDGFYSNRFNWVAGSASYTLNSDGGTVTVIGGANLGHTDYADFATPLPQNNSAIVDLGYSILLGNWTLSPYIQMSEIAEDRAAGLPGRAHTGGAAMLLVRRLDDNWSIGARGEYLASQGPTDVLYGAGSKACSFTITPTYQKGVMFARAEASYVAVFDAQPGAKLGKEADSNSQARLMIEAGILF